MESIQNIIEFFEVMKKVNKIFFKSESIENSEMNWNYKGIGNIEKTFERTLKNNERVYFFEELKIENNLNISDKKMWEIEDNKVKFYRYRNDNYEKIFSFYLENNKFHLEEAYICFPDKYKGKIEIMDNNKIVFTIEIKSKTKNEKIEYTYVVD